MIPGEPQCPIVVLLESSSLVPAGCRLRIRTARFEPERLACGRIGPEDELDALVPDDQYSATPKRFQHFAHVGVTARAASAPLLMGMLDWIRRPGCEYVFPPSSIGDGSPAMMAAELGVPVRLAFDEEWPPGVLERLLEFFLHNPSLQVPVEPFFSLASAIGQPGAVSLWTCFDEALGVDFYIDCENRVTLSPRWARQNRYFGSVSDASAHLRHSALWSELSELKHHHFESCSRCSFCPHYPYCQGFWMTTLRPQANCQLWSRLMDRLLDAWRTQLPETSPGPARSV